MHGRLTKEIDLMVRDGQTKKNPPKKDSNKNQLQVLDLALTLPLTIEARDNKVTYSLNRSLSSSNSSNNNNRCHILKLSYWNSSEPS